MLRQGGDPTLFRIHFRQAVKGNGLSSRYLDHAGCIATFLEDFLEVGQEAANLLTCDEKASLLAVARRKVTAIPSRHADFQFC